MVDTLQTIQMSEHLELWIHGERWVSYPLGFHFPKEFIRIYPFRGRGLISKMLYVLNRLRVDAKILRHASPPLTLSNKDVAFFWPAPIRSRNRYYGYMVQDRRVVEYWKIAVSDEEKVAVRQELNI